MKWKTPPPGTTLEIGVISDTHGLLRPEAYDALQGVDMIVHAGDLGAPEILPRLESIAPVIAVKGNVDKGSWADQLLHTQTVEMGKGYLHVIHDLDEIDIDPKSAEVRVVVYGHSHKPRNELVDEVLYLNPGSAGPKRFDLPVSLAKMTWRPDAIRAEMITLSV